MKRLVVGALALLFAANMLFAVPAIKKPISVKQADGTTITIYLRGDENTKWCETLDGYSLLEVDGQFFYTVLDKDGNMVASKVKAHDKDGRTRQEKKLLRKTPQNLRYSEQQLSKMRAGRPFAFANDPARTLANSSLAKSFKARKNITDTVVRRAPIILVNFADRQMTTPKENYYELVNGLNYTQNGCTGSFRDYFSDNSRGLFKFEADVIGPVTLSHDMAYYGGNDGWGSDRNPDGMAAEACRLAAAAGTDFSLYDFDNDGYVDGVHLVFAGKGEETTREADAIWSHAWAIYEEDVMLNGKQVFEYSCSAELSFTGDWACIGAMVHELSHVFGLPDLYDTQYGSAVTPDEFDVMDGGSYNNNSKTPPLHNAWSRIEMGWLDPVELTDSCQVELYPAQEATDALYYNTPVKGEYFVLDYRGRESKWDQYIPGYGMLIFAVNENVKYYGGSAWDYNCVNCDPKNRGFYIKQADGGKDSEKKAMGSGTPFPGSTENTSFTDDTEPASTSHSGQRTDKPITQITEMENGGVSFVFIGKNGIIRDNFGNVRKDSVGGGDTAVVEQVAAPVFYPLAGVVKKGTEVSITTATENASIFYTTDGGEPASGTEYIFPIVVDTDMIITAIALKEGMDPSEVVTARYTVEPAGNENGTESVVRVYPNPNNGSFNVELVEEAEVSVFGLNGSLLKKQRLDAGVHEMRIEYGGTYVLRVNTAKASVSTRVTVR